MLGTIFQAIKNYSEHSSDSFPLQTISCPLQVCSEKLLEKNCGDEDWCRASVFQIQNEIAFREILVDVGICYDATYEQARSTSEDKDLREDLRKSSMFKPIAQNFGCEDQLGLQKRLKALASGHRGTPKECLPRYLLGKLNHKLDTCSTILWAKKTEPSGTWGTHSRFLGSGSAGTSVYSTK